MDPVFQRRDRHYIRDRLLLVQHGVEGGPHAEQAERVARSVQEYME